MRRFIAILTILVLSSVLLSAGGWVEMESVEIPPSTKIFYSLSESGKVEYFIVIEKVKINISRSNAEGFIKGQRRLELVKWYNPVDKRYKYTVAL